MSMPINIVKIVFTTDGSGDYSNTALAVPSGRLLQYRYVYGDAATGANLDLTGTTTGWVYINHDSLGTSSFSRSPRIDTHDEAGAAALYASGGIPVYDYPFIGDEPLTFTIASGGATKTGTFYLWIG